MKRTIHLNQILFSLSLIVAIFCSSITEAQVNANVTAKTKALYNNLKKMQNSENFLFGQEFFNSYMFSSGSAQGDKTYSDAKSITGSHPALLGSDFHYYLEKDVTERGYHTEALKYAYQQGYVITMDWHISARGTTSYNFTGAPANLATNIATDSSSSDGQWYLRELDKVIKIMNEDFIVGGDTIPIVFRPWHEMNGNWFWWGTSGLSADNFKKLYQLTASYVKKRTKTVLFLWTPNTPFDLTRYPGDDYVDVLGLDYYQISQSSLRTQLGTLVDYVQSHGKVAVLSETGSTDNSNSDNASLYWKNTLLPAILSDPTGKSKKIAWVLTWINASWSIPYVPYASTGATAKQSFIDFKNTSNVIFGDEIPYDMYTFTDVVAAVTPEVSNNALQVYPVPSSGIVTINVKGFSKPVNVVIFDSNGKSLYQSQVLQDETVLNVKEFLRPGVYILKASDHAKTALKKLLVN